MKWRALILAIYCVTGAAGFIGFHTALRLLADGFRVLGIDDLNDYYDVELKEKRLNLLREHPGFVFRKMDIADRAGLHPIFEEHTPEVVIHLAAQAGVRFSLEKPEAYVHSNLDGFVSLLQCCRHVPVRHLLYASSSSVYGHQPSQPFSEIQPTDRPLSLYAATKKANELMAHAYSHLYGIPATGLRFFTVYGPWGRPDMAYFKFADAMMRGSPIQVYNYGNMKRDFTYIGDAVEAVVRLADVTPAGSRVYNIGNRHPERLMDMIAILEKELGCRARLDFQPMQPGDVEETCADTAALRAAIGYEPDTPLEEGLPRFVKWYLTERR